MTSDAQNVFAQLGTALNQLSQRLKIAAGGGSPGYLSVPTTSITGATAALVMAILGNTTIQSMAPAAASLAIVIVDPSSVATYARQVFNVMNLLLNPPAPTPIVSTSFVTAKGPVPKVAASYPKLPPLPSGIVLPPTRTQPSGVLPTPPAPDNQPGPSYSPPDTTCGGGGCENQGITNIPPGITPDGGFAPLPGAQTQLPTAPAANSPFTTTPPKTHWQKYKWWYIGGGTLSTVLSVVGFLWTVRPQKAASK